MAETDDSAKWDRIFSERPVPGAPARVLEENLHLLPRGGDALELAAGTAGNAVRLARLGFRACAWDISTVAVERVGAWARAEGLPLETEQRDLTRDPPVPGSFDVIVVEHFLDRALVPYIRAALRPGGLVFYQTFTLARVTDTGPGNPAYRLGENELLRLFEGLVVLVYREEGLVGDTARGLRDEAMLVARAPDQ